MNAILEVTHLVEGATVSDAEANLEPVLPSFLRLPVPAGTPVGFETYVVVKVRVHAILPG